MRRIVLPFGMAVAASAVQNFQRDCKKRLVKDTSWLEEKDTYLNDAAEYLSTHLCNHPPYYDEHEHIVVDCMLADDRQAVIDYIEHVDAWYMNLSLADVFGIEHWEEFPKPIIYCPLQQRTEEYA